MFDLLQLFEDSLDELVGGAAEAGVGDEVVRTHPLLAGERTPEPTLREGVADARLAGGPALLVPRQDHGVLDDLVTNSTLQVLRDRCSSDLESVLEVSLAPRRHLGLSSAPVQELLEANGVRLQDGDRRGSFVATGPGRGRSGSVVGAQAEEGPWDAGGPLLGE